MLSIGAGCVTTRQADAHADYSGQRDKQDSIPHRFWRLLLVKSEAMEPQLKASHRTGTRTPIVSRRADFHLSKRVDSLPSESNHPERGG